LASLRSSFGLRRQQSSSLGRCFVATLQPAPDLFGCPLCGNDPAYIVIDGQALGFRLSEGLQISHSALHLPIMNLSIDNYAAIRAQNICTGVRKVVRTGDTLNRTNAASLGKLHDAMTSVFPRSRAAAAADNWRLTRHAATIFFHFNEWKSESDLRGARPGAAGVRAARVGDCGGDAAPAHTAAEQDGSPPVGSLGDGPAPASASVPWDERVGTCRPRFDTFAAESTEWAALRPFILAMLGDPVVNLFVGHPPGPLAELAEELQKADGGVWRQKAAAADAVGFVANLFARIGRLLDKDVPLRLAAGALLSFAVDVDKAADRDFSAAAKKAAEGGPIETAEFYRRWLGVTTPAEYGAFAAEHPAFKDKNLDSPYISYEYFGFLERVRPDIYTQRVTRKKAAEQRSARGGRRGRGWGRGAQAAQEDAGNRCAKAFPKHSELTAGVFNIVCPHMVTMGFRVMFAAERVAEALSVILERVPKFPKVVLYDVACKMNRNGVQRVRTILSHHGVRFCLGRAHAKGHTYSCVYFPDESLAVTNGVSTQAAEVQHSMSVKF